MSKNDDKIELEIINISSTGSRKLNSLSEVKSSIHEHTRNLAKGHKAAQEKAEKVKAERREASRLASMVNKRLKRLEANGLENSPAYKAVSGKHFSVRGKSQAEVQAMMREMKKFIAARTSTIRGINAYAKEMAETVGLKYNNLKQLQKMLPKFFELSSKVEQYLHNVEDMAGAIAYHEIWEQVNVYVQDNKIDLAMAEGDIDAMIKHVAEALKQYNTTTTIAGMMFRLKK